MLHTLRISIPVSLRTCHSITAKPELSAYQQKKIPACCWESSALWDHHAWAHSQAVSKYMYGSDCTHRHGRTHTHAHTQSSCQSLNQACWNAKNEQSLSQPSLSEAPSAVFKTTFEHKNYWSNLCFYLEEEGEAGTMTESANHNQVCVQQTPFKCVCLSTFIVEWSAGVINWYTDSMCQLGIPENVFSSCTLTHIIFQWQVPIFKNLQNHDLYIWPLLILLLYLIHSKPFYCVNVLSETLVDVIRKIAPFDLLKKTLRSQTIVI